MAISTQVCNATARAVKLQVGSARYASDVATIAAGGKHAIAVDFNATYREYIIGVADAPALEKIVVSSDDLCDCKCITIKEGPNGTITVEKEPRQSDTATSSDGPSSQTPKKAKWIPAWLSRSEK